MDRKKLAARLETGFFAAHRSDHERASSLLEGRLWLAEERFDVMEVETFDRLDTLTRSQVLQLHSLRWLDVLRRAAPQFPTAGEVWSRIFATWASSATANDQFSAAWVPTPLLQRSTVLALGGAQTEATSQWVDRHLERLVDQEARSISENRLHSLRVRLALQASRGDTAGELGHEAIVAATQVFDESGYAVALDLAEAARLPDMWRAELRELGVAADHPSMSRLGESRFWEHAMKPDGTLVSMGGQSPSTPPCPATPALRYVTTGGADGQPPSDLSFVNPRGLVSLRSGWGETERDVSDEIHVSIVVGPVRGRAAHRDPSRIAFYARGREWLVDPEDPAAAGAEAHSIVHVSDRRYRTDGSAEVVQHYSADRVEGVVLQNSLYHGVRWERHAVFVRTGNYLVVVDTVKSAQPFSADLQWMIAPDVEISKAGNGFRLAAAGNEVRLAVNRGVAEARIDPVLDADGRRIAWRVRVALDGPTARAIWVIAEVGDPSLFEARTLAYAGKESCVHVRDRHFDENVIITPALSAVAASSIDLPTVVLGTVARAAMGTLSPDEALRQRIETRRAIEDAKARIRADGEGSSTRARALIELTDAARRLRITGSRDHGIGAALVDIAGTDLVGRIRENPLVRHTRRSALVRWSGEDLRQPDYHVPVHTSVGDVLLPAEMSGSTLIWSVDCGQLVPSAYIYDAPGEVLTAYFHGATDRTRFSMPRYERLRSLPTLDSGPVMFFSGPCLDLDAQMILSWFAGTEDLDLHRLMARMVNAYAIRKGLSKVLLVGNSGGGFTALQVASHLSGSNVIAFNPQIQIDQYIPRLSATAHWALFGSSSVAHDPKYASRMDLIMRYGQIGFEQSVTVVQNPGDDLHYRSHFIPFREAFEAHGASERFAARTPDLGPGHRVPTPPEYLDYVRKAAMAGVSEWELHGLR